MGTPAVLAHPTLPRDQLVYRAYPFADSLNKRTGKPEPKLFYRKLTEETLSVGLSKEAIAELFPSAVGMCALKVADIRECPDALDVIQDASNHGSIVGIPLRTEDREKAIRIAKYLVRISEHCPETYIG